MTTEEIARRFSFHPADTEDKRALHEDVRAYCRELAGFLNDVLPEGREKALAVTSLEESMFWSNAALARP